MSQPTAYCKNKICHFGQVFHSLIELCLVYHITDLSHAGKSVHYHMTKHLPNYFKTFRKLHGLTQQELSQLLGYMRGEQVSRLECRRKEPTLRVVLAYKVLFDIQIEKLIPGVYREVKSRVHGRLERFIDSDGIRPGTKHLLTGLGCMKDVSLSNNNSTQKHDIK